MLSKTRNPFELAELMQISVAQARENLRNCRDELLGWGRLQLQPHIISRKRADAPWPKLDAELIKQHQGLHDQGRVTMCQGRDGGFILLYAIPTQGVTKRPNYFTREDYSC